MTLTVKSIGQSIGGAFFGGISRQKPCRPMLVVLLLGIGFGTSSAGATTWDQWQYLPHEQREAYVIGVVDAWRSLLGQALGDDTPDTQFLTRLNVCLDTQHLLGRHLVDLVEKHGRAHLGAPREDMVSTVIVSVEQFCGLQRGKKDKVP